MHLSSDSVSDMYATVSNLVIAIFLVTQIYPSMKLACSAIKLCSDFTYAFFPAFCIICATSGAAMTSFSVNGSLLLFSQTLNFISSNVFLPIIGTTELIANLTERKPRASALDATAVLSDN